MARCTLAHGDRVVATFRTTAALDDFKAKYTTEQLPATRPDVTSPLEIKATFAKTKETFGRIDVMFNNAGYAVAGEAEAVADELARARAVRRHLLVRGESQEAVRFFREENRPQGGRLI